MNFRLAIIEDLPQIMDITKRSIQYQVEVEKFQQWNEHYPNESDFLKDMEQSALHVLEKNDQIVGFIVLNKQVYDAYEQVTWSKPTEENFLTIHRVAVDPEIRNQRLGFQLLTAVEALAKSKGVYYLKIDTNSRNLAMNKLILNVGYTFCGEMDLKPPLPLWNCYDKQLSKTD